MLTHYHMHNDPAPQQDSPAEPEVHESEVNVPVTADKDVIAFKLNRQTLAVSALVILLVISGFETYELTRLHQALRTWQSLPAAAASATATATPASASGGSALPSQVGGC